jgi:hypothetical protein
MCMSTIRMLSERHQWEIPYSSTIAVSLRARTFDPFAYMMPTRFQKSRFHKSRFRRSDHRNTENRNLTGRLFSIFLPD